MTRLKNPLINIDYMIHQIKKENKDKKKTENKIEEYFERLNITNPKIDYDTEYKITEEKYKVDKKGLKNDDPKN